MTEESSNPYIEQHGMLFSFQRLNKTGEIAFKDHPQLPILTDILSRKYRHHAILLTDFSSRLYQPLLEAALLHFNREHSPYHLRTDELMYLDLESTALIAPAQEQLERYFAALHQQLTTNEKYLLLSIRAVPGWLKPINQGNGHFLRKQLDSLLAHPKFRLLVLSQSKEAELKFDDEQFATLTITNPSETDVMALLKQHRGELESFHHVIIPEEILIHAYMLAGRYLSTTHTLEKTLLLLDSSAARAASVEHIEHPNQYKPVLTPATLAGVLSSWTHVPAALLQSSKFKLNDFTHGLEQRVFGQDAAINLIGHELQQAIVHAHDATGPFCSLLFAGPEHSGKKTMAVALAEQLFKHTNTLYFAQLASPQLRTIAEVKLQRYEDRQRFPLKEVIQHAPYAIIVFENVDQASPVILDELYEILTTGYLYDSLRSNINFHQAIVILSTTLGSKRLHVMARAIPQEDETSNLDLLQLLMSDKKREEQRKQYYLPHEMAQEVLPEVSARIPAALCKYTHLVPFLPLNRAAAENIIRLKLKALGSHLEARYRVELSYAPEIVRFLARDAIIHPGTDHQAISMDKALKQLYFTVEQSVLSQMDNPNRTNQLFLQLNETGKALRCDWSAAPQVSTSAAGDWLASTIRHHTT